MTDLRVLHVVRGMPNSSGTTHIVKPLAEEQARQGADVSVWLCEQQNEPPVTPDPDLVRVQVFPVTLPLDNPGVSLPFFKAISSAAKEFDFVHIHAVWNFPTWSTMRACARAGVPFMVAPQGSFEPWAMQWRGGRKAIYARAVELPLMNKAYAMQALSRAEVAQMDAFGVTAPKEIVPNGIDPEWFALDAPPLRQTLGLPEGTRTLLSLSRLHPKKGVDMLIRGFSAFRRQPGAPDVTLVVAGGDFGTGYRQELEQLAAGEGAADSIRFIGEVRGEEKYRTLLGADAFALISHSEGLPVAVLEAMASGLPVVITPGCNIPEVAEAGAGLVIPPGAEETTKALTALFGDPDAAARMAQAARDLVEAKFTWRRIAEQTLAIYRGAAERRA